MERTEPEDPWSENDGEALEAEIMHADDTFEVDAHGTTAEEATKGISLDDALARERPDRATVDEVVAIEEDAAPDDEDELIGDATLERDGSAAPEEAAISIREQAPGATDHPDPHDVDEA
jgi:hypothetical protein